MMFFQQVQHAFIAHIKDPDSQPAPMDIEARRMAIYRDLFFNNVLGFVSSAFPVLKSLYTEPAWQGLVRQFFIKYQCSSPYFLHIAEHLRHAAHAFKGAAANIAAAQVAATASTLEVIGASDNLSNAPEQWRLLRQHPDRLVAILKGTQHP